MFTVLQTFLRRSIRRAWTASPVRATKGANEPRPRGTFPSRPHPRLELCYVTDPKQLEQQALAAFQKRDRDAAGEHLRALAALDGRADASWGPLARMAMVCGETDAALALFRREAEPKPSNAPIQAEYAGLLAQANRMDEALEVSRRLVEMLPQNATALHLHGTLLSQIGDRGGAEDYLGRAVDEAELSGPSWLALSALKRFNPEDPDYKRMESLRERIGNTPEDNRPSFQYALGKARLDAGEERGFEALGAGADMVRGQRKHDVDANRKFAERLMDESRADASLTPSGLETDRPIFVSGLPRCGSTLVEQILSSHSGVAGGGELNLFRAALMPVGQPFPSTAELYEQRAGDTAWRDIGEAYLRMISERFGETGRVVDKTLNHSRHMAMLRHSCRMRRLSGCAATRPTRRYPATAPISRAA